MRAFGAQVDKAYGWRTAFIAIGVAGVIAALLMLFVVREPKRGAMDPAKLAATAHERSSFSATFWQFISRPVLLWTAMGCGLSAFVGYAALGWNASFLLRTLQMTRDELSLWYALVIGVGIGIGTLSSGFIVDVMAKRSRVWYALTPLIAMVAATPFWYLYTQAQDWPTAHGQARGLAMVQGAVYDAVNAIDGTYEPYLASPVADPGDSTEAAAAAAACCCAARLSSRRRLSSR